MSGATKHAVLLAVLLLLSTARDAQGVACGALGANTINGHVHDSTTVSDTADQVVVHGCNNSISGNTLGAGVILNITGAGNVVRDNAVAGFNAPPGSMFYAPDLYFVIRGSDDVLIDNTADYVSIGRLRANSSGNLLVGNNVTGGIDLDYTSMDDQFLNNSVAYIETRYNASQNTVSFNTGAGVYLDYDVIGNVITNNSVDPGNHNSLELRDHSHNNSIQSNVAGGGLYLTTGASWSRCLPAAPTAAPAVPVAAPAARTAAPAALVAMPQVSSRGCASPTPQQM